MHDQSIPLNETCVLSKERTAALTSLYISKEGKLCESDLLIPLAPQEQIKRGPTASLVFSVYHILVNME